MRSNLLQLVEQSSTPTLVAAEERESEEAEGDERGEWVIAAVLNSTA